MRLRLRFLPLLLLALSLSASPVKHSVTLTWFLSTDNSPQSQTVWRQKGCIGPWSQYKGGLSTTTVEWVDNNVAAGKTYCYAVTVKDNVTHKESPMSNVVQVTIPTP